MPHVIHEYGMHKKEMTDLLRKRLYVRDLQRRAKHRLIELGEQEFLLEAKIHELQETINREK